MANTVAKTQDAKVALSQRKRRAFLKVLARTGRVGVAAEAAGYESTAFLRRCYHEDPEFAAEWDAAEFAAADFLEDEAKRRAHDGVMKPVFYKGEVAGYEIQYSDQLLMFVLKGLRPDKYADRKKVENTYDGKVGVALLPMTATDLDTWELKSNAVHAEQKHTRIRADAPIDAEFTEVKPENSLVRS